MATCCFSPPPPGEKIGRLPTLLHVKYIIILCVCSEVDSIASARSKTKKNRKRIYDPPLHPRLLLVLNIYESIRRGYHGPPTWKMVPWPALQFRLPPYFLWHHRRRIAFFVISLLLLLLGKVGLCSVFGDLLLPILFSKWRKRLRRRAVAVRRKKNGWCSIDWTIPRHQLRTEQPGKIGNKQGKSFLLQPSPASAPNFVEELKKRRE